LVHTKSVFTPYPAIEKIKEIQRADEKIAGCNITARRARAGP
jgi:hypothetical protein